MSEIEEPVVESEAVEEETSEDVQAHSADSVLDLQGDSVSPVGACASVLSVGNG
ncbi:MAG: hypothetical protein HOW97_12630 [Catenulispora sp.]|nr:hypothetical protein [Catenulispora sp.]